MLGYSLERDYLGCASPRFADVAAAASGSDSFARLQADLEEVMLDCYCPGWDGYDAKAISAEAFQLAQRFVHTLPPGIPVPSVSADAEGCVTFEWHASPRRLVLVSVHPDFRIDYAAVFGNAKSYGSEPFFDKLPIGFCDLVRRVYLV